MSDKIPAGGSFVVEKVGSRKIFTPEDFSEEQKQMAETATKFCLNEMLPKKEQIDKKEEGLVINLIKRAGEEGLLMVSIPEEYEGLGLDKTTFVLVNEALAPEASSFISMAAHTCIGSQPLIFFGNEEQKKKYLPKLATGEMIACYALTETGAGSDAMGCKCKAVLSEDGKHYILNGSKQFITNGGWADLATVFARIDGEKEKFSAFLVESSFEGYSAGPEEKKMGLKGSSTTPLVFEDCKVPVENLLGEIGMGGRVAFSVLDLGRLQVGGSCAGAAKWLLKETIRYGSDRQQFKTPIINFGMIRSKVAEIAARIFALESITYRSTDLIDAALSLIDDSDPDAKKNKIHAVGNYAPECSVVKVYGSEALDWMADQCIQIYGGYGYTEEYPAEKVYRDCRVNRIFEGTNEINRSIAIGSLVRGAMKGEIPLIDFAKQLEEEIEKEELPTDAGGPLGKSIASTELSKRLLVYCLNLAFAKFGKGLQQEQEILELMADMLIDIYCMDSSVCRALQLIEARGESDSALAIELAKIICFEGHSACADRAMVALMAIDEEKAGAHLAKLKKVAHTQRINLVGAKKKAAEIIVEAGEYKI